MLVRELKKGQTYWSKSHELFMIYCGVEYFKGHKYHNFYEPSWKLYHWLKPNDVILPKDKP